MRLKHIKLAGFKSFVDPTLVAFPDSLTAIVGPNGCGKSNVIDAVRWVMGESSAKHLRGSAMTDVIFNGSSARKPVGQASIELVFDNSDRTLLGEFAGYDEISVKRQVNREAQSTYFLNQSRCRRKDVADLFLGTGLGPRSYAIIEQGMISRLIESKPQELRVFLEEAAGISKYKERRKETEQRMRRTEENLARVADLCDELGKRIAHLKRQAEAAEKYKSLKKEERLVSAKLHAGEIIVLDTKLGKIKDERDKLAVEVEAKRRVQTESVAALAELESAFNSASETLEQKQADYYEQGAKVTSLTDKVQFEKNKLKERESFKTSQAASLEAVKNRLKELSAHKATLEAAIADLTPKLEQLTTDKDSRKKALDALDEKVEQTREAYDKAREALQKSTTQTEVLQTEIAHFDKSIQHTSMRLSALEQAESNLEDAMSTNARDFDAEISTNDEKLKTLQLDLDQVNASLEDNQSTLKSMREQRESLQTEKQRALGEQRSLETLQQAALTKPVKRFEDNLTAQNIQFERLVDTLDVESGYEKALETVLWEQLDSVVVDTVSDVLACDINDGFCAIGKGGDIFGKASGNASSSASENPLKSTLSPALIWLVDVVEAKTSVNLPLTNTIVANHLDHLKNLLEDDATRTAFESGDIDIVTTDGFWWRSDCLLKRADKAEKGGVLARKNALEKLQSDILITDAALLETENGIEAAQKSRAALKLDQSAKISDIKQVEQKLTQLRAESESERREAQRVKAEYERVHADREALVAEYKQSESAVQEKRKLLESGIDSLAAAEKSLEAAKLAHETARSERTQAESARESEAQAFYAEKLRLETLKTELTSVSHQQNDAEEKEASIQAALDTVQDEPAQIIAKISGYEADLQTALSAQSDAEAALSKTRDESQVIQTKRREAENRRHEAESMIERLNQSIQNYALKIERFQVEREQHLEQIEQLQSTFDGLKNLLTDDDTPKLLKEALAKIQTALDRLGAVNLAAIEEFDTQSERKVYLDEQRADLEKALATLQDAIQKIDEETKARFETTFNTVNDGLQVLFPKVFGGGEARLELTEDDMLETGVSVIARPPGKRNSTIHLLSGGEKALTAIALVFAIFKLNPAPFCMLDEVDAPLDDSNVARFCNLVREMSKSVQFIYISHNKLAMEMANHLMGVTMQEPGVSRLVSVDVEEALSLTD